MKKIQLLLLSFCLSCTLIAQVPGFSYADLNGNQHSLYDDYLNNGIPVVINISAAWAGPDWNWHETNVLEDFYQNFGTGTTPDAMVLHIETDLSTDDNFLTGNSPQSMGDWTLNTGYPIINTPNDSMSVNMNNSYQISYYPTLILVCPDGQGYAAHGNNLASITLAEDVYHSIESSEELEQLVFQYCGIAFDRSQLHGFVYDDVNDNCANDAETGLSNMTAHITGSNGIDATRVSNSDGEFRVLLEEGTYQVDVSGPNNDFWEICNPSQTITVGSGLDTVFVDCGAEALVDCPYMTVDITAPVLIRCFESSLYVDYCNEGTITAEDAYIEVTLDSFFNYVTAIPMPTSQNGNVLTFDLGDVPISTCGTIQVEVEVSCDSDTAQLHCYQAHIYPDTTCTTVLPRTNSEECQQNVGSWDPNDKRAFPLGVGPTNDILPNTEVKYQIRFQNTGTFTAFNVYITDEIPEELDLSTLQVAGSSHPYHMEIEGRLITFFFDDINLPHEEADEPGSHGFINFFIKQNVDLANGVEIKNDAAIYFDFNEPVITNTHIYTINDMIVGTEDLSNQDFSLSPNPANDFVKIQLGDTFTGSQFNIQLMNIDGKILKQQLTNTNIFEFEVQGFATGVYFLRIENERGEFGVKKIVLN